MNGDEGRAALIEVYLFGGRFQGRGGLGHDDVFLYLDAVMAALHRWTG